MVALVLQQLCACSCLRQPSPAPLGPSRRLAARSLPPQAFLSAHFGYAQALIVSQLRSSVTAVVFRKALAVPAAALAQAGSGRVQVRAGAHPGPRCRAGRPCRCVPPRRAQRVASHPLQRMAGQLSLSFMLLCIHAARSHCTPRRR